MTANPRIDGIVAADAPVAVIFRRGPSKLFQQLVWNLDTDEVLPGQWIRGRVYTRRCDLSPNGRYLVGSYTNYSTRTEHRTLLGKHPWSHCGWTAISRPPYFSAIALWFTGGAWSGGGLWKGPREVHVNNFLHHWEEAKSAPRELVVKKLGLGPSEDEPLYSMLLRKRGWGEIQPHKQRLTNPDWGKYARKAAVAWLKGSLSRTETIEAFLEACTRAIPVYETTQSGRWVKPFLNGSLERWVDGRAETWSVRTLEGKVIREFRMSAHGCQFLEVDHRGRVIFGDQGQLWAWEDFPKGEPRRVADLRPNKFENVAPPDWALEP